MRKTISARALEALTSKDKTRRSQVREPQGGPSRRKRAVKSAVTPPSIFDRLAQALQPELDEVDAAWIV